jgi:hypothetical protein
VILVSMSTRSNTAIRTRSTTKKKRAASSGGNSVPPERSHRKKKVIAVPAVQRASPTLTAKNVAGANDKASIVASEEDNEDGSSFEVDAILELRTTSNNGVEVRMFLVSWTGYDDPTWEPEANLPPSMVSAFVRRSIQGGGSDSVVSSDLVDESSINGGGIAVCATCGKGPDGLGRVCARCKKPMHHFCATDVCVKLGLKTPNGDDVVEFPNDVCFCSSDCYAAREGAVRAAKKKRKRTQESSDSDYETDGDVATRKTSKAGSAKKPTTKTPSITKIADSDPKVGDHSSQPWPPPKPKAPKPKPTPISTPKPRDPMQSKMVAFSADVEDWMPAKLYKDAKGLYMAGRAHPVKRLPGERATDDMYEVRWTNTSHQSKQYIHRVNQATLQRGIQNFATISGGVLNKASWRHICQVPTSEVCDVEESLDDYVILDGSSDIFLPQQLLPENLELVEQIKSLDFQPSRRMREPSDLFTQEDGTEETKLRKEKSHLFETASSSFFAYLPISFWKTVVAETNEYATQKKGALISLDELLKFFGIMFYMTVIVKGEYSNYWGNQVESEILGISGEELGLDKLMTLKRFQFIRQCLCFRSTVSQDELRKDPAARIRPLINMLKYTSPKYVVLGRKVAVDESSVACRSKYGRHLIVFNSSKPTGKFHFKIYACCCATSWLMVGFRLHCSSDMQQRLKDVIPSRKARHLEDRLQFSSSVRQIVLEVTQPLHGTKRVVNTDNFYTSVTLLLSLRDVGLYGRGTIREASAHFPKAHMFAKKAKEPRGSSLQGVSSTGQMIAASWMDGSAVNLISNADSSEMGEVSRLIGKEQVAFPAPKCVAEYNKHMQGVDRLDQLRAKYSLADGHSMKKWHKKLALAFIDIARVNAYVTRGLRQTEAKASRNPHRDFMIELSTELITGSWKETTEDEGMLFADDMASSTTSSPITSPRSLSMPTTPKTPPCTFVLASVEFPGSTRGKRGCKVCKYEGRTWTMKTNYCQTHNVCLCSNAYEVKPVYASVTCPHEDWSCWRKYHEYYLPLGVFNDQGRIKRSSTLFKARRRLGLVEEAYSAAVSPPTLLFSPFDGVRANAALAGELYSPPPVQPGPFSTLLLEASGVAPVLSPAEPAHTPGLSTTSSGSPAQPVTTPGVSVASTTSTDYI